MKITVGFSKARSPNKIGSKLIAAVEKRDYSHAFILYTDSLTGLSLVAQSSRGFMNLEAYPIFLQTNVVVKTYEFEVSDAQFKDLMVFIQSNLGVDYGFLELVLIGIKKVFHVELNIHDKDESLICSEFVGRVLETIGILNIDDMDYLTPSDLENAIIGHFNK